MAIFNSAHPALSGHPAEWGQRAGESVSTATRVTINGAIKLISDTKLCSLANVCAWGIGDADNSKSMSLYSLPVGASLWGHRMVFSGSMETAMVDHEQHSLAWWASRQPRTCATSLNCFSRAVFRFGIVRPNLKCAKVQRNLTPVGLTPIGLARKLESRLAT